MRAARAAINEGAVSRLAISMAWHGKGDHHLAKSVSAFVVVHMY